MFANTYNGNTRVNTGTLLLNKTDGATSVNTGTIFIGNDQGGANSAVVRLGNSNQIVDTVNLQVNSTGLFDLNNNTDVIGTVTLVEGPNASSTITTGTGLLTLGGGNSTTATSITLITVQVLGGGNSTGTQISATWPSIRFTTTRPAYLRVRGQWQRRPGEVDLNINGTISDGTGLVQTSLNKLGYGVLEFSGSTANTYAGTTTVTEGTLLLNKSSGVNAIGGVNRRRWK